MLVAYKLDLRDDPRTIQYLAEQNKAPIQYKEGVALKERIGAVAYVECSSVLRVNVEKVFEEIARAGLSHMDAVQESKCNKVAQ